MAKKFVKVTGLHQVFNISGNSYDITTLKNDISSVADNNSILFIDSDSDDTEYGYESDSHYIWSKGTLFNQNQVPVIISTHQDNTNEWKGNLLGRSVLVDGQVILYRVEKIGTEEATLTLTLSDDEITEPVYWQNDKRIIDQIKPGTILPLLYLNREISGEHYQGWWVINSFDVDKNKDQFRVIAKVLVAHQRYIEDLDQVLSALIIDHEERLRDFDKVVGNVLLDHENRLGELELNGQLIKVTYQELIEKRDSSSLVPGASYMISDFRSTTDQPGMFSEKREYKIIIKALGTDKLSKNYCRVLEVKKSAPVDNIDRYIWIDNFTQELLEDEPDILQNYHDDWMSVFGGVRLHYLQPIEYNRETFYLWELVTGNGIGGDQWVTDVQYALTRELDFTDRTVLDSPTNQTAPIYAYLGSDKSIIKYEGGEKHVPSAWFVIKQDKYELNPYEVKHNKLYIEKFACSYDDVDWTMYHETDFSTDYNYDVSEYHLEGKLDWDNQTFYLWRLVAGQAYDQDLTQYSWMLTKVADFTNLTIHDDIDVRYCPVYCFLSEDQADAYMDDELYNTHETLAIQAVYDESLPKVDPISDGGGGDEGTETIIHSWVAGYDPDKQGLVKRIYTDDELWFDYRGGILIDGVIYHVWYNQDFDDEEGHVGYLCSDLFNVTVGSTCHTLDVNTKTIITRDHSEVTEINQAVEGTGNIIYLKDEYGNTANFDFKNIRSFDGYVFGGKIDKSSDGTYQNNHVLGDVRYLVVGSNNCQDTIFESDVTGQFERNFVACTVGTKKGNIVVFDPFADEDGNTDQVQVIAETLIDHERRIENIDTVTARTLINHEYRLEDIKSIPISFIEGLFE